MRPPPLATTFKRHTDPLTRNIPIKIRVIRYDVSVRGFSGDFLKSPFLECNAGLGKVAMVLTILLKPRIVQTLTFRVTVLRSNSRNPLRDRLLNRGSSRPPWHVPGLAQEGHDILDGNGRHAMKVLFWERHIKMADASPETLSALVFGRKQSDGDRMTAGDLIAVLEDLMYRDGGIQDPRQIAALVRRFDQTGLTLEQFRQVLMGVDTYLRSLGYNDLETRLAVNVLGAPPPVQRVEVPVVAAGPRLTDPVPNTPATYGDIAQALSPREEERAQLQGPECMEVHRVSRNLNNFERGMSILVAAVEADPRFRQYMINSGRFVNVSYGFSTVSDGDRAALLNFIKQKMMTWLERSDIGAFRDPERRRLLVEGLLHQLQPGNLSVVIQGAYAGNLMLAVVLFMDTALRDYPTMQTTWAETVVRDGIEAYDEDIDTYPSVLHPHISCPNGIIERFFTGLAGIIVGSAPAAPAPAAPAPAAPAPVAPAPVAPAPDQVSPGVLITRRSRQPTRKEVMVQIPRGVTGVQGEQVAISSPGWVGTFRYDPAYTDILVVDGVRRTGLYTRISRAGGGRTLRIPVAPGTGFRKGGRSRKTRKHRRRSTIRE